MELLINVLIIIASIILILIVLVQNSKGGGLTSNLSSSNQMMGVRKTTDVIEKATWGFAIGLVVLCLASTYFLKQSDKALPDVAETEYVDSPDEPAQETGQEPADAE